MRTDRPNPASEAPPVPARRDFLRLGLGFGLIASCAGALGGCARRPAGPAAGCEFLRADDVELFTALAGAVIAELAGLDAGARAARTTALLRGVDTSCAALGAHSQAELRRLLDLLALAPARYVLTGIGAWRAADAAALQRFLERWRSSRFGALNAGANALVKLVAVGYYLQPATWDASGYPGPLARLYDAANA